MSLKTEMRDGPTRSIDGNQNMRRRFHPVLAKSSSRRRRPISSTATLPPKPKPTTIESTSNSALASQPTRVNTGGS